MVVPGSQSVTVSTRLVFSAEMIAIMLPSGTILMSREASSDPRCASRLANAQLPEPIAEIPMVWFLRSAGTFDLTL